MHEHHHHEASAPESYDKHAGHHTQDFLKKFWIALALTIPVLGYSEMAEMVFGSTFPVFTGSSYLVLLLGSIIFFYCGWIFLTSAYGELKARLPGMMTLIALATTTAYAWSVYAIFTGGYTLFGELSTLIVVMLLGHWIEMRTVLGAKGALRELAKLMPDTALVLRNGAEKEIPLAELVVGDVVLVKPGAQIASDGVVESGISDVNEAIITGESRAVAKKKGDEVIAGSINGDGALTIRVTKIGEQTFLAGVMRLVAEAERSKSRIQLLADRTAFWLTIIAVASGVIAGASWVIVGAGVVFAIERLVSVFVIACPHALGLAIPLVASISTTMSARQGILIKRRLALEAMRTIDTVVFDKTGTLTSGKFSVTFVSSDEVLALASAIEVFSEHPIAQAVVAEGLVRQIAIPKASDVKRIPGVGAEGMVEGKHIFVGQKGGADILVEVDGVQKGIIRIADTVREESMSAVRALKDAGLSVVMITGDADAVAGEISRSIGIDEYFARVTPEGKSEKIKLLQQQGKKVAFVGDGVNDAPALAQADVGIAIGAGTNVAIESAGIILMRDDPRDVVKIIRLSRATHRKMIQNLFWATGYNVVAIPVAGGILYTYGIMLQPAVAALLMSLSTVIVAVNAVLLKRATI